MLHYAGMDDSNSSALIAAAGDLVHLLKEGFFPLCVADDRGGVAALLTEDRESYFLLAQEARRLVDAEATVRDLFERVEVPKQWYALRDRAEAIRLIAAVEQRLSGSAF